MRVLFSALSEGNAYNDGTEENPELNDGFVPPGEDWTYNRQVPERAGPGPNDGSSVMWPYHGHVNETGDTNGGLVGPIVITAAGMADPDGSPNDVDVEVFTLFTVFDENSSIWIDENIAAFAPKTKGGDEFEESNLMHGINGLLAGDWMAPEMSVGQNVRWYLMAMGTEVDMHTAHWHGNTVLDNGQRSDVVSIFPAMSQTVDMTVDNSGTWMYHCHVNDHLDAGMMAVYIVSE